MALLSLHCACSSKVIFGLRSNPAQSLQLGYFFVNLSGASARNYRVVRQRCMKRRLHVVEQEKLSVQTEAMMPFWVVLEIKST